MPLPVPHIKTTGLQATSHMHAAERCTAFHQLCQRAHTRTNTHTPAAACASQHKDGSGGHP
jgi:hypothetical protein